MAFGRMTTKWRIFRRPLDTSLVTTRKIIVASMMLHNFVITEEGLQMNNLADSARGRFGVEALPPQVGLDGDNNGFIPAEDGLQFSLNGSRRQLILNRIIELELQRPFDNCIRNG